MTANTRFQHKMRAFGTGAAPVEPELHSYRRACLAEKEVLVDSVGDGKGPAESLKLNGRRLEVVLMFMGAPNWNTIRKKPPAGCHSDNCSPKRLRGEQNLGVLREYTVGLPHLTGEMLTKNTISSSHSFFLQDCGCSGNASHVIPDQASHCFCLP